MKQARKALTARNKPDTTEEQGISRDPYPVDELDEPADKEPTRLPSAKVAGAKVSTGHIASGAPKSLREIVSTPTDVTLDRVMGLGELVAEIQDDVMALHGAILEDGETMDDKVWERLDDEARTVLQQVLTAWPRGKTRTAHRN